MMPLIIVFGIRGGIFTATEGGAIISVYGLLVGMFIYKEIRIRDLPGILLEAAESSATIGTIIAATTLFSWLLTSEQIPAKITNWMIGLTDGYQPDHRTSEPSGRDGYVCGIQCFRGSHPPNQQGADTIYRNYVYCPDACHLHSGFHRLGLLVLQPVLNL